MAKAFHRRIAADGMAVRALLYEMRDWLSQVGLDDASCGKIEIALAEALNNVVEHAYAGTPGAIRMEMTHTEGDLQVTLRDKGAALPRLRPPAGHPPALHDERDALPEGGFGWFLIRNLTRGLHYARDAGENRLTLVFDLEHRTDPAP